MDLDFDIYYYINRILRTIDTLVLGTKSTLPPTLMYYKQ